MVTQVCSRPARRRGKCKTQVETPGSTRLNVVSPARHQYIESNSSPRIFAAILLLILSLTLGASYGWATAYFLVPFILSIFLFPAFFYWERRLPASHALIPPVTWSYPNFPLWVALNIFSYAWWTCCQIPVIEVFTEIRGDLPIVAAVRVLPSGIFSLISSIVLV